LDFVYQFNVQSYSIQNAGAWLQGQANFNADQISGTATANYYDSWSTLIGTVNIGQIGCITVLSVPLCADASMPINLTSSIFVSVTGEAAAQASAQGSVLLGFNYTPENGFQYLNNVTWGWSGGMYQPQLSIDASVVFGILPQLVLTIDGLASLTVAAWAGAQALILSPDITEYPTSCSNTTGSLSLSVYAALQLSLSAAIDITVLNEQVYSNSWGPDVVYSNVWPVMNPMCWTLPLMLDASSSSSSSSGSHQRLLALPNKMATGQSPVGLLPGHVYHGQLQPNTAVCPSASQATVSFIYTGGPIEPWLGIVTHVFQQPVSAYVRKHNVTSAQSSCVDQQRYDSKV
jgi:hypothetical protein